MRSNYWFQRFIFGKFVKEYDFVTLVRICLENYRLYHFMLSPEGVICTTRALQMTDALSISRLEDTPLNILAKVRNIKNKYRDTEPSLYSLCKKKGIYK